MNRLILPMILSTCFVAACGGPEDPTNQVTSELRYSDPNDPPDFPDPPEEDEDTVPTTPPLDPGLQISQRTSTQITVRWRDNTDNETGTVIERYDYAIGNFVVIKSYGSTTLGFHDYADTAVVADGRYCYRVKTWNSYGTRWSPVRCAWTAAPVQNAVFRLQLRVRVADVDDAGTDDGLSVRLNSESAAEVPYGNLTAMDYGRNDFERNSSFIYDLDMAGISDLADINQIHLFKGGDDGVCLSNVGLIVNDVEVFDRSFAPCRWLDNEGGSFPTFTISHAELRAHPFWSAFVAPPVPLLFTRPELESRLEGLVGNAIAGTELDWGHISGRPLEVGVVAQDTFSIDLDLEGDSWLPNPEVDVDIDMRVAFAPSATIPGTYDLTFTTVNSSVNVDYSWWAELISIALDPLCAPIASIATWDLHWDCASSLENYIENRVENAFQPIEKAFNIGTTPCAPFAVVAGDGSIRFTCQ